MSHTHVAIFPNGGNGPKNILEKHEASRFWRSYQVNQAPRFLCHGYSWSAENILQHSRFGPCLILRFLCSLLSLTSLLRYLLQASPCARSLPTFRKESLQMGRGGGGVWYPDLLWHSLESCVVASKNPSFLLLVEFMEGYIQMSRGARKLGSGMLCIYPAQLNGIV